MEAPTALSIVTFGVGISVSANSGHALRRLLEYLPPGWQPAPHATANRLYSAVLHTVDEPNSVHRGGACLATSVEPDAVLRVFENDVQIHVAETSPDYVFVHAGVVGWRDRAILVPGRSFTGKTTLVSALLRLGATYYSDEYAVLDAEGLVHPYARPLSVRAPGLQRPGSDAPTRCSAGALGARIGSAPLPVGLVVVTGYERGAEWRPRTASPGQGAMALLDNTVPARYAPQRALETVGRAACDAMILIGARGDAETAARDILQRCEA